MAKSVRETLSERKNIKATMKNGNKAHDVKCKEKKQIRNENGSEYYLHLSEVL